jgi:hypothetical protein
MGAEVLTRMLTAALGASAINFTNGLVNLFTNDVDPGPGAVTADFVAPTYTGYATPSLVLLGAVHDDAAGNVIQRAESVIFQPTDSAVSDVIIGYWVAGAWGGGSTRVICYQRLPIPVTLASPLDALVIDPLVAINQPVGL